MIPDGWKSVRFADIAEYKSGRTPARANPAYWVGAESGIPWVAISDMAEFGTVTETKEKITRTAFNEVFRGQTAPAGTLIMSFKLTIGRVATLGIDACHNEAIISIYPKPGVDQRYLGYFLSQVSYDELQDRQIKGNTLNQEKIDRIEVWLPPFDEQTAFADVLSLLRRSIATQDGALSIAQTLKGAAMRELFTRGLRGEPQKEIELGLVPESWEVEQLGDIATIAYGAQAAVANATDPSIGTLILTNVNLDLGGHINLEKRRYYKIPEVHKDRLTLRKGDVLFNWRSGSSDHVGKTVYFDLDGEFTYSSFILRFRPRGGVTSKFLFRWLTHLRVSGFFTTQRNVSSINSVYNASMAATIPVWFPRKEEQEEIVAILDAIDRKIALHRQKRAVLESLFGSVLHKMMTGEIRAPDLDLSVLRKEKEQVAA